MFYDTFAIIYKAYHYKLVCLFDLWTTRIIFFDFQSLKIKYVAGPVKSTVDYIMVRQEDKAKIRNVKVIVAVAPGSTMLNASASGRDADFPGSRGSGVSGT